MNNTKLKRDKISHLLLDATMSGKLEWSEETEPAPSIPNDPPCDFYSQFDDQLVDLGKWTKNTPQGPRQAYFIRLIKVKNGEGRQIDFFDDYDLATPDLLAVLYTEVKESILGTDKFYVTLLEKLEAIKKS